MTDIRGQLSLDFAPARSANADPETSRIAGRKHGASGMKARNKALVYAAVCDHPGLTSLELAPICGLDRWETARRLSDLEKVDGLIHKDESRTKRINGRSCVTWWPAKGE